MAERVNHHHAGMNPLVERLAQAIGIPRENIADPLSWSTVSLVIDTLAFGLTVSLSLVALGVWNQANPFKKGPRVENWPNWRREAVLGTALSAYAWCLLVAGGAWAIVAAAVLWTAALLYLDWRDELAANVRADARLLALQRAANAAALKRLQSAERHPALDAVYLEDTTWFDDDVPERLAKP
jgi:hypothetical protein